MRRLLLPLALLVSTAALARQSTLLDELRSMSFRYANIRMGIPVKAHLDNVAPEDIGLINRFYPYPGEEGQFTAVRFTPKNGMGIQEISFLAPNSTAFGVHCTVSDDRVMNLYISSSKEPPANATPDLSLVVPGQPGAAEGVVTFDVLLDQALWVPAGSSLFVAIEHPGLSPDVACLTVSSAGPDAEETEFWSFATEAPFSWTGYEDPSINSTMKPLVSVSGYVVF